MISIIAIAVFASGSVFLGLTARFAVRRARKVERELFEVNQRALQLHAANVNGDKAHNALSSRHERLKKKLRGLNALQRKNLGITEE